MLRRARAQIFVASLALVVTCACVLKSALTKTGGLVYPIDDAFIHLSIAKRLADSGVFGINDGEFAAASSSVAWPFVLAFARKFVTTSEWVPLALNIVAGVGSLVLASGFFRPLGRGAWLAMAAFFCFVPLAPLVLTGMEHTLHLFASLWLLRALGKDARAWVFFVLAAQVTAWRYEGGFLISMVALVLFASQRVGAAALTALGGCLPIAMFGVYSMRHGGGFLPSSVTMKSCVPSHASLATVASALARSVSDKVAQAPYLVLGALLVTGLSASLVRTNAPRCGMQNRDARVAVACAGAAWLHIALAGVGWFYRYEAYLLALLLCTLLPHLPRLMRGLRHARGHLHAALLGASAVLAGQLAWRGIVAVAATPVAMENIADQQVKMARFLSEHFSGEAVAVNDIGAVSYFGQGRVIDLLGLANEEAAAARGYRIYGSLDRATLENLAAPAAVAVIYDEWFPDKPVQWTRLATWTIHDNRVCAFPSVSIYATHERAVRRVQNAWQRFEALHGLHDANLQ